MKKLLSAASIIIFLIIITACEMGNSLWDNLNTNDYVEVPITGTPRDDVTVTYSNGNHEIKFHFNQAMDHSIGKYYRKEMDGTIVIDLDISTCSYLPACGWAGDNFTVNIADDVSGDFKIEIENFETIEGVVLEPLSFDLTIETN